MLLAEGVMWPEKESHSFLSQPTDHDEYRVQLQQIRHEFMMTMAKREEDMANFSTHTDTMMKEQSLLRPISKLGVEFIVNSIRKKFIQHMLAYKQETCEKLMANKSKFCDARRKRRNFSKKATEILNNFFKNKIESPYPTEEEKEKLAKQCNITVAQVSNWFGNRRIRYKKNLVKVNEERERTEVAMQGQTIPFSAAPQPMMLPAPFMDPSLMAPFHFYFPPY
ncbi:hypothetical protein PMAYCL1PPCAC_11877, partial [Pristionchus mayeri]